MIRTGWVALTVWLAASIPAVALANAEIEEALAGLPSIQGPPVAASALEGRVLMVVFFASWCPPCRKEFPALDKVQDAYETAGLRVIAVNVFETFDGLSTPEKLARFLAETAPKFSILKGDRAIRRLFFDLDRIPTIFVFARDGQLATVFRHECGATKTHLTEAELRAAVEPLL